MARIAARWTVTVSLSLAPACYQTPSAPSKARSAVLFIADGLGPAQVALGLSYARIVEGRRSALERLMERGMTGYALPISFDTVVIDSAASASQMSTGVLTRPEMLAMDPDGRRRETLIEWAEARGMLTGVVTTTRLTHATPAGFASHQLSRYVDEQTIADQILDDHDIDVLLGGGARAFIPRETRVSASLPGIPPETDGVSWRNDERNLVENARRRGYAVASDRASLEQARNRTVKLLGLFASSHMPYEIDRVSGDFENVPSLDELTRAALVVLDRARTGFFVVIEGGRIDHAGHDNDPGTLLREVLAFDRAVEIGLRFQEENPDTLVLVTADHGTGGFSFTYSGRSEDDAKALPSGGIYRSRWFYPGKAELDMLSRQSASYERILERAGMDRERLIAEVERATGLVITREEAMEVLARDPEGHAVPHDFDKFYADYEDTPQALVGRALARQTSVVWSTGGHTSDPVLTFGVGPGAEKLRGVYANTRIYEIVRGALED